MKFALYALLVGELADVRLVGELANAAEAAGYDGWFTSDWMLPSTWPSGEPESVADTQVALTAIGLATSRIQFGAMVTPLPRRSPVKVAVESLTLDRLSGGRVILAAGTGHEAVTEYLNLGDSSDARARGDRLDEALAIIDTLLRGHRADTRGIYYMAADTCLAGPRPQQPRLPIWLGTGPDAKRPLRRAARYDGVFLLPNDFRVMSPDEVAAAVAFIAEHRGDDSPFDVAIASGYPDNTPEPTPELVSAYEAAGVTWWVEYANTAVQARALIDRGRPDRQI